MAIGRMSGWNALGNYVEQNYNCVRRKSRGEQTMSEKAIKSAARRIRNAWKNGKPIKPVRETLPPDDLGAAYASRKLTLITGLAKDGASLGAKSG